MFTDVLAPHTKLFYHKPSRLTRIFYNKFSICFFFLYSQIKGQLALLDFPKEKPTFSSEFSLYLAL